MFSIKRIVLPVSSLRVLISDNGGYDIVQVVFVPCLLPPKSRSTTRLNPSSPVKLSPNPTSKSRGFLGVSRIKGSIFVLFPLCGRIGVWVRRHVATKASIEMSHFELSAPSAALNSSKKQKGPIIVIDNYEKLHLQSLPGFDFRILLYASLSAKMILIN